MERPRIGIGIIIQNEEGQILVGKRKGSHSPYFSIPGGHLERGESFETGAIREVAEETGLQILNPQVCNVTNNLQTYQETQLHYISINLFTNQFSGEPQVLEPDRCEGWTWVDPKVLPQPHFEASSLAIAAFLEPTFYQPS